MYCCFYCCHTGFLCLGEMRQAKEQGVRIPLAERQGKQHIVTRSMIFIKSSIWFNLFKIIKFKFIKQYRHTKVHLIQQSKTNFLNISLGRRWGGQNSWIDGGRQNQIRTFEWKYSGRSWTEMVVNIPVLSFAMTPTSHFMLIFISSLITGHQYEMMLFFLS